MTSEEAEKFYKRALGAARSYGFSEHAEDFAQEVVTKFISGQGRHQTVDQALIDIARRDLGDPRSGLFELRRAIDWGYQPLDALENHPGPVIDRSDQRQYQRVLGCLEGVERAIIILMYEWGFLQKEIAHCLGVTEGRISQRLSKIQKRVQTALRADETPRPNCPSERIANLQTLPPKETERRSRLEQKADVGVEKEKPREVEISYEESFDEWLT